MARNGSRRTGPSLNQIGETYLLFVSNPPCGFLQLDLGPTPDGWNNSPLREFTNAGRQDRLAGMTKLCCYLSSVAAFFRSRYYRTIWIERSTLKSEA
jgi:hypothetical protein